MNGDDADEAVREAERAVYHTQWRIWEELALQQLAATAGLGRAPLVPGSDVIQLVYPRPQDLAAGPAPAFDRAGIGVLIPLTVIAALYAPLAFLGGFWAILVGVSLWGLGMGVQESLIPAAVAPMVSPNRRAFAYGLFTGIYGTAWVLGSIVIGVLVSVSPGGLVAFCVASELAAIPLILIVRARTRPAAPQTGD